MVQAMGGGDGEAVGECDGEGDCGGGGGVKMKLQTPYPPCWDDR